MINTERNRALLTDLFAALGREGWGEVFLAALRAIPRRRKRRLSAPLKVSQGWSRTTSARWRVMSPPEQLRQDLIDAD